jgi:hypothetical protein
MINNNITIKKMSDSNEQHNNLNAISNPYIRKNKDNISSDNRFNNNILKNTGEELIINSKKALKNKYTHKSIYSPHNNSNKRMKIIYDPYLISVCKHAIIREKKELPNYREVIRNINTEFGIEESEKENYGKYKNSHIKRKINLEINVDENDRK